MFWDITPKSHYLKNEEYKLKQKENDVPHSKDISYEAVPEDICSKLKQPAKKTYYTCQNPHPGLNAIYFADQYAEQEKFLHDIPNPTGNWEVQTDDIWDFN